MDIVIDAESYDGDQLSWAWSQASHFLSWMSARGEGRWSLYTSPNWKDRAGIPKMVFYLLIVYVIAIQSMILCKTMSPAMMLQA
jgi:hypothetical protein